MKTSASIAFDTRPAFAAPRRSKQDLAWQNARIEDTRLSFTSGPQNVGDIIEVSASVLKKSPHQLNSTSGTNTGFELLSVIHLTEDKNDGAEMMHELRRVSGLTLRELATLIDVSERSLHYWMAGERIAQKHLKTLGELTSIVRYLDAGSSEENRNRIFSPASVGHSVFDLLKKRDWQQVREYIEEGIGRRAIQKSIPASDSGHYWKPENFGAMLDDDYLNEDDDIRLPAPKSRKVSARKR